MRLLEDDTKRPFPDAMPVPGGTQTLAIVSASPTEFEPTLTEPTSYYIYSSGDCYYAVHNDEYTFVAAENAILPAGDVRLITLGDPRGKWTTLTMQGVAGNVDFRIEELQ